MESTPSPKTGIGLYAFCDDVRLEVGNKLSYMGVFQNIIVPQLPVWLPKLAVVNHWRGDGAHLSEVRILMPDRQQALVVSQPARFEINQGSAGQHQFLCERDACRWRVNTSCRRWLTRTCSRSGC